MRESEFGRGLVVCLVKFAEHFERGYYTHTEFDVQLWANGASDHLYDIQVPKKWKGTKIEELVLELQDKGLDMGHGSGLMDRKKYTKKDVQELKKLTEEIALLIDQNIGLKNTATLGDF